jgi:hypothetical protein
LSLQLLSEETKAASVIRMNASRIVLLKRVVAAHGPRRAASGLMNHHQTRLMPSTTLRQLTAQAAAATLSNNVNEEETTNVVKEAIKKILMEQDAVTDGTAAAEGDLMAIPDDELSLRFQSFEVSETKSMYGFWHESIDQKIAKTKNRCVLACLAVLRSKEGAGYLMLM